jgi:hypothetical protein
MRHLRWTIVAVALSVATVAHAQGEPRGDGRHGRGAPGGRADSARTLDEQNPIAMLLEHSDDLALTSDQTNRIAAIKQRLNARQRPLVAELDSLRPPGPPPHFDPTTMSAADRDSLMARRRAVGDVMAEVRTMQQAARTEAWTLLTADQQKKADEMENRLRDAARRPRDEEQAPAGRRGRGGSGDMGGRAPG